MTILKTRVFVRTLFPMAITLATLFLAKPGAAQTYQPGPAPTAEVNHVTVESIPAPTSRTTIGIKEQVTCSIQNWQDVDYEIIEDETTNVNDSYGTVTWTASSGTCNPTTGASTTYTAPESASDTSATVTMTADDSPLGNDAAIQVAVAFAVKVPTGDDKTFDSDSPLGDAGPPNSFIGASSYWWPQVKPTTVSFKDVNFRTNAVLQTKTWPDGTNVSFGPSAPGWNVAPRNGAANVWTTRNIRSTGKYSEAKLLQGGSHIDWTFVWSRPWEFESNGAWTPFADPFMQEKYTGATLKAKVAFNGSYGGEQGPYKN